MLAPKFSLGGVDMPWRRKSSPTIIGPSPSKGSCSSRTIERCALSRVIVAVGNGD
jgi:hypothetical protein